jgi:hypothetical protein
LPFTLTCAPSFVSDQQPLKADAARLRTLHCLRRRFQVDLVVWKRRAQFCKARMRAKRCGGNAVLSKRQDWRRRKSGEHLIDITSEIILLLRELKIAWCGRVWLRTRMILRNI